MSESRCDGPIGARVGNFKIVSLIGRGGMSEVYLAEHEAIKTRLAIKTLLPQVSLDSARVQRLFNEAIAGSRIKHAGTAKVFDVGFLECGRAYLAMEFLEGETLTARIRRAGRLSLGQLAEIARQIASVLDATHRVGVTHRDLKPENVFLVPDVELELGARAKIIDFGIAKLSDLGRLTSASIGTMGTPDYMAPEQWRDSRTVDWRADAYSLGCIAFEMATGRVPFPSRSVAGACTNHLNTAPPAIRDLVPDLPDELDALVSRLLRKQAEQRPSTMIEITRAFAALTAGQSVELSASRPGALVRTTVQTGAAVAIPPSARDTASPPCRSAALLAVLGSISVLLLAIFVTMVVSIEKNHAFVVSPERGSPIARPRLVPQSLTACPQEALELSSRAGLAPRPTPVAARIAPSRREAMTPIDPYSEQR